MNKHDEWFKSLIEALEKDPRWDIDPKTTTSKQLPDRDKTKKPGKKK